MIKSYKLVVDDDGYYDYLDSEPPFNIKIDGSYFLEVMGKEFVRELNKKVDITHAYKFINGELILDSNRKNQIINKAIQDAVAQEKEAQRLPSQVYYTSLMTDTLLPNDENSNEHSPMFEKIKEWYLLGLWNEQMVRNAVEKGQLTEEEYREIVESN